MLHHTTQTGRALLAALALSFTGSVGFAADAHYYVNDPLATTVAIADAAGEIAAIEADAFGSPLAAGEAPSRYTGKPYDADLGAFVFPFRNYRPEEARWMSADPSGFPDGVNGMAYAASPFTGIDPLGLAVVYREYTRTAQWTVTVIYRSLSSQVFTATGRSDSVGVDIAANSINNGDPLCEGYGPGLVPGELGDPSSGTPSYVYDKDEPGSPWTLSENKIISNTVKDIKYYDGFSTNTSVLLNSTDGATGFMRRAYYITFTQVTKGKEKYVE